MNKLPKGFYLGSIAGGWGLFVLAEIVGAFKHTGSDGMPIDEGTGLLGGIARLAMLYSAIVGLVLWYKAWAAIQDGQARTTPGKAIGFLFIPIFNIYWMFQAIWGFSKDYNSYIQRHQIGVQPLPEGLFLASCIIPFANLIPLLNMVAGIAGLVVSLMVVLKVIDAVNALPEGGPVAAAQRAFPVGATPPTSP